MQSPMPPSTVLRQRQIAQPLMCGLYASTMESASANRFKFLLLPAWRGREVHESIRLLPNSTSAEPTTDEMETEMNKGISRVATHGQCKLNRNICANSIVERKRVVFKEYLFKQYLFQSV